MNEDMPTPEKFMQAVNAVKLTLDTVKLEKNIDMDIAVRHNLRRKLRMIRAMEQLYAHKHRNEPLPVIQPSAAFDPFEGVDKTNLHYLFKAMRAVPPWELRRDLLLLPTAATILMVEVGIRLFPPPKFFECKLLMEEFINRWTLPKHRPEWTDEDLAAEIERWRNDIARFEQRFNEMYTAISIYFHGIENPETNPIEMKIDDTHCTVKEIDKRTITINERDKKFRTKSKAKFTVKQQDGIYNLWMAVKNDSSVKKIAKGKPDHEAALIQYGKEFNALGAKTPEDIKIAIRARRDRIKYSRHHKK